MCIRDSPLESLILLISAGLRGMKYINLGQISELLITPILFLILFIAIYLSPSIPLTTISTMAIRVLSTLVALVFSVIFLLNKTPRFIFTAKPAIQGKLWSTAAIPLALSSGLGMIKSRITILLSLIHIYKNLCSSHQERILWFHRLWNSWR